MKRTALALALIASFLISLVPVVNAPSSSSSTPSGPPAMEWDTFYGAKSGLTGSQMIQTSDGGYAAAGTTNFNGTDTFWLVKTDAGCNLVWNQTYGLSSGTDGTSFDNNANSVVQTTDGGYALAGHIWIHSAELRAPWSNVWLVKTDSLGNMVWNQTFGDYHYVYSLIQTSDGGLAFAGNTPRLAWIVKLDAAGNAEWNQTYPNRSGGGNGWTAYRLIETSDGGFALAGSWKHTSSVNYYFLVKTEPALPPPTPTPTPSSAVDRFPVRREPGSVRFFGISYNSYSPRSCCSFQAKEKADFTPFFHLSGRRGVPQKLEVFPSETD